MEQNFFESLAFELLGSIIWHTVFVTIGSIRDKSVVYLLQVCRQWYRILININTMVIPISIEERIGKQGLRWALYINRAIIMEGTIAQYLPHYHIDAKPIDKYETVQYLR